MPDYYRDTTILHVLRGHADVRGDREAVAFVGDARPKQRVSRTFHELVNSAMLMASKLLDRLSPGDRVLVALPPGLDYVEAFLACIFAGVIAVPAVPPRPGRRAERVSAMINDCSPRVVLCLDSDAIRVSSAIDGMKSQAPSLMPMSECMHGQSRTLPQPRGCDIAFLQYTSGSTAAPKGVAVTHHNLIANQESIKAAFRHSHQSKVVSWLPPFHDMGLIGSLLQPLYVGFPSVHATPQDFVRRPRFWFELITSERATTSGAPNFAYDHCVENITAENFEGLDLSTWQVAFNGSEPVRWQTCERFCEKFATVGFQASALLPCYGLAEATLMVSGGTARNGVSRAAKSTRLFRESVGGMSNRNTHKKARKQYVSCGAPVRGVDVVVVDPNGESPVDTQEEGEICVRGDAVAMKYWGRACHLTTFNDIKPESGWLRTGDLGFLEGGEVFVTGRVKDVIIVRGLNVHAVDIEDIAAIVLNQSGIKRIAALDSMEDPSPTVILLVESASPPSPMDVRKQFIDLRRALLSEFSVPLCELLFVRPSSLPITSSGKLRRHIIADQLACGKIKPHRRFRISEIMDSKAANTGAES